MLNGKMMRLYDECLIVALSGLCFFFFFLIHRQRNIFLFFHFFTFHKLLLPFLFKYRNTDSQLLSPNSLLVASLPPRSCWGRLTAAEYYSADSESATFIWIDSLLIRIEGLEIVIECVLECVGGDERFCLKKADANLWKKSVLTTRASFIRNDKKLLFLNANKIANIFYSSTSLDLQGIPSSSSLVRGNSNFRQFLRICANQKTRPKSIHRMCSNSAVPRST